MEGGVPDRVPVAIWNTRSSIGLPKSAKSLRDYYDNIDIKLEAQLQPLKLFEDTLIMPGIWPDYGVILEASAFGCKILFSDKYPPHAFHFMKEITEVNKLNVINPKKDGLMPKALQEYEYMLKNIPSEYLKNIGYLDGCALTTGPLEVSAMILGYENFYLGFYAYFEKQSHGISLLLLLHNRDSRNVAILNNQSLILFGRQLPELKVQTDR